METDDDDATTRERFALVQSILFIDFTDILPAYFQEKMVESCGETMQFGLVSLITDSGGNSWCPWLYSLRAYHVDNLCSSKSDVLLRFWSWYDPGLHKLWYPGIRDRSTWGKFGAHGEHGDVFLFSNLGALWFSENLIRYSLHVCLREVKNNLFSFKHSYLRHFSWRF